MEDVMIVQAGPRRPHDMAYDLRMATQPPALLLDFEQSTAQVLARLKSPTCACAKHSDGSVTTMLCSEHADHDPCQTMASVTGRRRKGSIVRGTCTGCGWKAVR